MCTQMTVNKREKKNYLQVFRAQENKGYKYDYKKVFIR